MADDAGMKAQSAGARHGLASWVALLAWIALAATAGALGAIASRDAGVFYGALAKPSWAPPGWLFGPVWSALYVLMGVAAWLVWRAAPATAADRAIRRRGLALFVGQLALNALWTWLFFAWRQGTLAFGEILILWVLILATVVGFWRARRLAGVLMLPYLAWVSFAAALTYAVWQRNPSVLA